ncbi:amidohydrolase family protein [Luteolibacter sp. SL250]|uniref:amidohydrolase family protein n=1 Tax=Luteolibacter sp. SL250 TaxID=2995170 RepID=UPI00226E0D7F|nr:amidohydrolase family protein [Luteolibacter sp. SL250]WAC20633.1 amidohydrolase family protein [Luteolibacter sp. SL250]
MSPATATPVIDCHVHLVGNGRKGSGCWIRMSGWHRWLGGFMAKMIGMPVSFEHEEFDAAYVSRLADFVKESSADQILLLAQEEVYHEDGTKRDFGSFHVPNDYLFEVCSGNPAFLPAVSIHPARKDALEELDRCLAQGARALKLLPNCLDVDCSRPAYDAFWEKMAEAGLPMLAHTGGEMTVPVANKLYQDPRYLERPLEIGVKIIAAHAASNSSLWDEDYFDVLVEMMRRHPNLYGDSSALNTPVRSSAFAKILHCDLADRFVHGSDFPVPVGTWYARMRGLVDGPARAEAASIPNLIERDLRLKKSMGFPEGHFTRVGEILRKVG